MLMPTSTEWAKRLVGMCALVSALGWAATAIAQEKGADKKWYDPILLDLGGGIPAASSENLQFIGNGLAGYVLPHFGIVARGSTFYYELNTASVATDTTRNEGGVEGWFSVGAPEDALRLQIRASGGSAWYDMTYKPLVATAGTFHDEDSMMGRGNLFVGGEFQTGHVNGYLVAGAGYQWESYDYLTVDPRDPNLLSSTTDSSVRASGKMQVRWSFVPDTLSARLRGDASYFSLTRENLFVRSASGANAVGSTIARLHQLELDGTLSIEADTIAFAGIVPFVFGGLSYVGINGSGGSSSVTVPTVGAGLFKPVWY